MRDETRTAVDVWWSGLFGIDQHRVWRDVTVQPHARLADYPGWYVAWRNNGVHVSAPSDAEAAEIASLQGISAIELQDVAFWDTFAAQRGLTVIGPASHGYLDADPGPVEGVAHLDANHTAELREQVTETEWDEAGWDDQPEHAFGWHEGGRLVAAANLTDWDGTPRDIGVLVVPSARGRGLAELPGRHAASYAIRNHGLARWCARTANVPSARTAQRLGFDAYVTQLAIRAAED